MDVVESSKWSKLGWVTLSMCEHLDRVGLFFMQTVHVYYMRILAGVPGVAGEIRVCKCVTKFCSTVRSPCVVPLIADFEISKTFN